MKILVAGEESQTICIEFRKLGHEAYSCDLKDCSGGHPEWHIKKDWKKAIKSRMWDIIIFHPVCDYLALCGNRWYGKNTPGINKRRKAIKYTVKMWKLVKKHARHAALENPLSVIWQYLPEIPQYIQPWQFGHGETKKTGLALHNLSKLKATNIVSGREQRIWKMCPSPDRKRKRSTTFSGIAKAMAEQWGTIKLSGGIR